MIIRDILSMKGGAIFSMAPGDKVAAAVGMMVKNDIGSLVVIEEGRMTGMVSFREVLKALHAHGGSVADLKLRDIMIANPVSGTPDDTLDHLRDVMTKNRIRYLPVQDGGNLVGVVSFHDVAKTLINETSFENRLLKRYIESSPRTGGGVT
jgi:CBS domain-containing protein